MRAILPRGGEAESWSSWLMAFPSISFNGTRAWEALPPLTAIEAVEACAVGSSALYGSTAIGGP